MQESEEKIVSESFSAVMPYLVYPNDLRKLVDRLSEESSNLQEFQARLEKIISAEEDSTHKTDKQIFLNELRKHIKP